MPRFDLRARPRTQPAPITSASAAGSHAPSAGRNHRSSAPSSTADRRSASIPGWATPFRHTRDTGDRGTGSTSGRSTIRGMGGKSTTARIGSPRFAMIRWNSSAPTASGAGGGQPYAPVLEEAPREVGPLRGPRVPGTRVHGLTGQFGQRHLGQGRKPMVLGQDDRHPLVAHRLLVQPRPDRRVQSREPPEGHIEASGQYLRGGPGQPAFVARHQVDVRDEFTSPFEDPAADQAGAVDVHQQGPLGLRSPPERGEQRTLRLQDPARVRQQARAVGCQRHLAGGADEQLGAQFPFQPADVAAERLLGQVETARRPGEVELLRRGEKRAQEAGVEAGGGHPGNLQPRCVNRHGFRCWTPGQSLGEG